MNKFTESLVELGIEVVKEKIPDVISEKQVRERLTVYLEQQRKLNFNVTLDEEIDFGGIVLYIKNELLKEAKQRFFGNKTERACARQIILNRSVVYAIRKTKLSQNRTQKIIGTAIDIIADFYRKRINKELLFMTGEIEDTVIAEHNATRELIEDRAQQLENVIHETALMSIDSNVKDIKSGELTSVEGRLGTVMNSLSAAHALFPYYGFRLTTENKMVSFPLTDNARKLYPENFRIVATSATLGEQPIQTIDNAVLTKAYRQQLPIYIDIEKAQKYLGDVLDPVQTEAYEMIGAHAIVAPPAFPPAFPCSVSVGEEIAVPYLLLRTKEILDDGTIVLTNEEQRNFSFNIRICLIPKAQRMTFTITPHNPTNKEYLTYRLFLKRMMTNKKITLYASEQHELFISGVIDETDIENLDAEIDLLQKVNVIEQFLNINIVIPEEITKGDHRHIDYIYSMIQDCYCGTKDELGFILTVTTEAKQKVHELTDSEYKFAYVLEEKFNVFNKEITVPIYREVEHVKFDNLRHLQEKIEIMDEGDTIKFKLVSYKPSEKCKYTDRIFTEELKQKLPGAEEM